MNRFFGYQILRAATGVANPKFDGTQAVLPSMSSNSIPRQVEIVAESSSHIRSCFSHEHQSYAYVWGIPVHPDIPEKEIPEWCAAVVAEKRYTCFRELIGTFVIIIDEPVSRRLTFVTDIMGVRPIFLGEQGGRLVFGSEVWPMQKAGMSSGDIDYDAVSSWIAYGYNCGDGSLFSDLRCLPPGSVAIFEEGARRDISYMTFEISSESPTSEQVVHDLHDIVSSTVRVLLQSQPRVSLALSGGFDSRYLLALSVSLANTDIDCSTVSFTEAEGLIARDVAKTLDVELESFPLPGSKWDLYDQVYHFSPDGFPISKFVTQCVAQRYPNIPMVNGFVGDPMIRGTLDKVFGKYETEWDRDLVDALHEKQLVPGLEVLYRSHIAKRIRIRSRLLIEDDIRKVPVIEKVFPWILFFSRQRHYISNNFLQHLGIAESLLPFYSWSLLSYKMQHDCKLFDRTVYEKIFQEYFPELAKIPHSRDLPQWTKQMPPAAKCSKPWSRNLLQAMCNSDNLTLIDRVKCMPRLLIGTIVGKRYEVMIHNIQRLYLLEEQTRTAGLNFDWEQI